jgi:hypothetical protein
MDRNHQFVVYSDSREDFLIRTNPSVWHYDAEYAIRFETEKDARTAAARRHSEDAQAGRLIQVDGVTEFEPLGTIARASPGTWIVTVTDIRTPRRLLYLIRGGRVAKMSTSADDAKGYKLERDARKAADSLNQVPQLSAQVQQKTAQILRFPGA